MHRNHFAAAAEISRGVQTTPSNAAARLIYSAAVTISGIEPAAKIRKHRFKVGKLPGRPKTIPAIWTGVIAA